MANNNNNPNSITPENLSSVLAVLLSQMNQGREGMGLEEQWAKEKEEVELNAIKRISNLSDSIIDVDEALDEFRQKTSGIDVGDLDVTFEEMLRKHNDDVATELQNFVNTLKEKREKLEQKQTNQAWNHVTNGRSGQVEKFGEKLGNLGDSFSKLSTKFGGKKGLGGIASIAGKAGGALGKFGGLLSKAAGPIGLLITAVQTAAAAFKAIKAHEKREAEFRGEFTSRNIKLETDTIRGLGEMAQNDIQMAQSITSNNTAAASAVNSAAISMAQEIGGAHAQLAKEGNKIAYQHYGDSHEIASSAPFDIKNTAYKAADMAIETAFKVVNFKTNESFAEEGNRIATEVFKTTAGGALAVADIQNEAAVAVNKLQNAQKSLEIVRAYDTGLADINIDKWDRSFQNMQADLKDAAGVVDNLTLGLASAANDAQAELSTASHETSLANQQADLLIRKAKLEQENQLGQIATNRAIAQVTLDAGVKAANQQFATAAKNAELAMQKLQLDAKKSKENDQNEEAKRIAKAWMKMTQTVNDAFLKAETNAFTMGREMGLTGEKLREYSKELSVSQMIVSKWGKDLEWIRKAQTVYQESTGRNVELTTQDLETSAAFGTLVGDDTIAEYTSGMEIFNHSVEDSNKKLYTMFKEVSKIGLNGKKYAKDLAKNLKLAEKYNFKGGVDSLMRMSKWAQNMRFNVGSLDGMLDKVQEGGLEGIIKQSAELQVLGGNFAMGSDPLAMAYESYMDPEGYAKRMNSMLAGQGVFDSETGEVSFGIASQQMMRQYAKSTGQDYKDVLNQARTQVKLEKIGGQLNGNYTEDQKSLIANKAKYNTETGQWEVNAGHKDADGNSIMTAVSDLTQADVQNMENVDPEDIDKSMLEQLQSIYSTDEEMKNMQSTAFAYMQGASWDKLREVNQEILETVRTEFFENFNTYKENLEINMGLMADSMQTFYDRWKEGDTAIDEKVAALYKVAGDINSGVAGVKRAAEFHMGLIQQNIPTMKAKSMQIQQGVDDILEQLGVIKSKKGEADEALQDAKWKDWMEKGEWKSGFAREAAKMVDAHGNALDPNSEAYKNAWEEINGGGWFDLNLEERGYEDWMTPQDAIEAYRYLLKHNRITEDGSYIQTKQEKDQRELEGKMVANVANVAYKDGLIQPNGASTKINDGVVNSHGIPSKINDGLVIQNGVPIRIDKNDQVLAAKHGGPIDKMIDMVKPRPMVYDSYVKSNVYTNNNKHTDSKIEIPPIQININGSIKLNSDNGIIDITKQISNDPNFIRALTQMIAIEVEKKSNGGRASNILNTNLQTV